METVAGAALGAHRVIVFAPLGQFSLSHKLRLLRQGERQLGAFGAKSARKFCRWGRAHGRNAAVSFFFFFQVSVAPFCVCPIQATCGCSPCGVRGARGGRPFRNLANGRRAASRNKGVPLSNPSQPPPFPSAVAGAARQQQRFSSATACLQVSSPQARNPAGELAACSAAPPAFSKRLADAAGGGALGGLRRQSSARNGRRNVERSLRWFRFAPVVAPLPSPNGGARARRQFQKQGRAFFFSSRASLRTAPCSAFVAQPQRAVRASKGRRVAAFAGAN